MASEFITHFESLLDKSTGRVVFHSKPSGRDTAAIDVLSRPCDFGHFVDGFSVDLCLEEK